MELTGIEDRLAQIRERMTSASERSGRSPSSVSLLTVTKMRSDEEIGAAYQLGLRSFGENRVPELVRKRAQFPSDIEWHLIGHLQSNKAKDCAGLHCIHSIDKPETALALEKVLAKVDRRINVLIEANTGGEDQKDGARSLGEVERIAETILGCSHLALRGLMTMAPFSADERIVRPCFTKLKSWETQLISSLPAADWGILSMGMTNDFEWAIEEGSTLVRIGTALFEGSR